MKRVALIGSVLIISAVILFVLGHDFMRIADIATSDPQHPACEWFYGPCDEYLYTLGYLHAAAAIAVLSLGGIATWLLLRSR